MQLKPEMLTSTELAAFDAANFEESVRMDESEWTLVLSSGVVVIWTARNEQNELAAVCVLKSSRVDVIWYCFSVAVALKYRGMRLGSRIYREAINNTVVIGKIQAHCEIDNIQSILLHQAVGFKAVQYVNDFYGDYKDAILWERVLDGLYNRVSSS